VRFTCVGLFRRGESRLAPTSTVYFDGLTFNVWHDMLLAIWRRLDLLRFQWPEFFSKLDPCTSAWDSFVLSYTYSYWYGKKTWSKALADTGCAYHR
jgi:hypothetical protein